MIYKFTQSNVIFPLMPSLETGGIFRLNFCSIKFLFAILLCQSGCYFFNRIRDDIININYNYKEV